MLVGHPFNPVHILPLLEVVGGRNTAPETIARALAFYTALGKKPLHCRTEAAIVVAAARMPAPAFYPRVADLIAARKTGIPCVSVDGPKRDAPGIEVIGYGPAKPLTRHLLQPSAGANPAQRLKQLMSGGVTNRGAKAMGGAGDEMARKLVELLVSEGFAT